MLPLISPPPSPKLTEDEFYDLGNVSRLLQAFRWLKGALPALWR